MFIMIQKTKKVLKNKVRSVSMWQQHKCLSVCDNNTNVYVSMWQQHKRSRSICDNTKKKSMSVCDITKQRSMLVCDSNTMVDVSMWQQHKGTRECKQVLE